MDNYITAAAIRSLREKRGMTQQALADRIGVSAKTHRNSIKDRKSVV